LSEIRLDASDILPEFQSSAKTYAPRTQIEGIEQLKLNRFINERGLFIEIFRSRATHPGSEPLVSFFDGVEVAQANFSIVDLKSTVKGLHYHLDQTDIWFCPPGSKMKIVLWDLRKSSATSNVVQTIAAGGENDLLVKIPPGVAHGYRPLGDRCALIYFVTRPFDPNHPDEYRVPWDHPRVVDLWEVENS
jgi:dTDP-4-dehydrorhamnose 3,5-epimerase